MISKARTRAARLLLRAGLILLLCVIAGWLVYAVGAHSVIQAFYASQSVPLIDSIMPGRTSTLLEDYLWAADRFALSMTQAAVVVCIVLAFLSLLIRNPRRVAVACLVLVIISFSLFSFLELFPSWAISLRLDKNTYYRNRLYRVPDNTLGFRGKPFLNLKVEDYTELWTAAASYDLDVPEVTVEWRTGPTGFRSETDWGPADIVLIGDSFIEYGATEADVFGKRLERYLSGVKVTSFGMSGYGPAQYLGVLK